MLNDENIVEEKEEKIRTKRIILIIIIIFLLILFLLSYKLGKIGSVPSSATPNDDIQIIEVTEQDIELPQYDQITNENIEKIKNTILNIFNNEKFNGQKIIAPKSSGTYNFCIKNVSGQNITYNIKFLDEMNYPVNMKYRLKMDNIYIRGNKNTYVEINNLNVEDIIVLENSNNLFTIEWYWEDDDINDTLIGSKKTDEYYTLNLQIYANSL